ncbi:MAG: DUF4238 domain-containing protein [Propionibacteriaceae bacterium]|nr:DUF4238 domain-containing protein [Propionibacteriaceae bacterium]
MASTRDHVVPQTYLRRFGKRGSNGHLVEVMDADNPEVRFSARTKRIAAEQDFHLALLEDGSWDHSMEDTLGLVETGATQAMSTLLDRDDPSDDAYPLWPCHPALRMSLALFVAAQVVRTVPQRERLGRLLGSATNSGLPDWVLPNMHLR